VIFLIVRGALIAAVAGGVVAQILLMATPAPIVVMVELPVPGWKL
jgi:hypothetical protein